MIHAHEIIREQVAISYPVLTKRRVGVQRYPWGLKCCVRICSENLSSIMRGLEKRVHVKEITVSCHIRTTNLAKGNKSDHSMGC